jgi:hypothetical protein
MFILLVPAVVALPILVVFDECSALTWLTMLLEACTGHASRAVCWWIEELRDW